MSSLCCLLKSKSNSHWEWHAKDKGGRKRWDRLWDRKRERHQKWWTDWEVEMQREMDWLKWGETFKDQHVNHSFDNCVGFSLRCPVMVCVCDVHVSFTLCNLGHIGLVCAFWKFLWHVQYIHKSCPVCSYRGDYLFKSTPKWDLFKWTNT